MENIFVKPALDAGGNPLRVRHPAKGLEPLKAEGDWWPRDSYTERRLRDLDVELADPPDTDFNALKTSEGVGAPMEAIGGPLGETIEVYLTGALGSAEARNLDGTPLEKDVEEQIQGQPLNLTGEERAALPPLDPNASDVPENRVLGEMASTPPAGDLSPAHPITTTRKKRGSSKGE